MTQSEPIGCPSCGTILNATAAGCADPWHSDNQPATGGIVEGGMPDIDSGCAMPPSLARVVGRKVIVEAAVMGKRINAAFEEGVAAGRRQATEVFVGECQAAATEHRRLYRPGPPPPAGLEDDRPRDRRSLHVAIGLEQARDMARRRLLTDGPWEPAEQAKPTCTCPMIDVTSRGDLVKGTRSFVQGYDPACPVCPNPHARQDGDAGCLASLKPCEHLKDPHPKHTWSHRDQPCQGHVCPGAEAAP